MAYSERFYHTYCKGGNTYRVSFQEWDYEGGATEVEAPPIPFAKALESSSQLKIGGVSPTTATVTFVSTPDFNMELLYTADETKYLIIHTINGVQDWVGNVIPNGFYEDRHGRHRYMTITASDRLTVLQGILFTEPDGTNYGLQGEQFEKSFIWAIKEALKKTGFLMPIWSMVDVKPLDTAKTAIYNVEAQGSSFGYFSFNVGRNPSVADEMVSRMLSVGEFEIDSASATGTFTVVSATSEPWSTGNDVFVTVVVSESVGNFPYEDAVITVSTPETGLVLARRGHFNDVAPSEIGIYKRATNSPGEEIVDFSFLKIGDTVKISESVAGNNGTYTVTGFVNSVPPDSPYIRIQLAPQVPVQIHENVVLNIISVQTDYPDPLAITTHDVRTWINESDEINGQNYFEQRQTAKTSWEVLDAIARQWNVRILQNGNHWEVVRWNAYKVDDGVYQWYVYNSEGTQIGRQYFSGTIEIPCVNDITEYEVFGSQIGMDRVLRNVNVNYRFKYKVDGDSLVNLIRNGNFSPPPIIQFPPVTSNPATYTPDQWLRRTVSGLPFNLTFFSAPNPDAPPGHNTFLRLQGDFMYTTYLTSEKGYPAQVSAGDNLKIEIWYRGDYLAHNTGINALNQLCNLVLRIMVRPTTGNRSQLVNSGTAGIGLITGSTPPDVLNNPVQLKSDWVDPVELNDDAISLVIGYESFIAPGTVSGKSPWRKYIIDTPPSPVSGQLVVEVVGIGNPFPSNVVNENYGPQYSFYDATGTYRRRVQNSLDFTPNKSGDITGLFVGKITSAASEAVPEIHGYTYPDPQAQLSRNYTDTIDDIEILTGDDNDEDHVSRIMVGNKVVSQWDTWQNEYGWSALGLVLAKSIMEQYWFPWRLLEGTFSAPGLNWSTRFMLEDRPGEKYVILRGALVADQNAFTGTLVQVFDEAAPPLPGGGGDGGNTTEPQWSETGTVRCVRDEDTGLNTGDQEVLERDVNPASPTYGQERWVNIGENTGQCPIGEPVELYWGEQLALDVETLRTFPFTKDGDSYRVTYTNDGGDRYLRLLHRSSLGTVQSILYPGGYESIAGWQYEADVVIDGYTYKHLRLTWFVGVISDFPVIFVIN